MTEVFLIFKCEKRSFKWDGNQWRNQQKRKGQVGPSIATRAPCVRLSPPSPAKASYTTGVNLLIDRPKSAIWNNNDLYYEQHDSHERGWWSTFGCHRSLPWNQASVLEPDMTGTATLQSVMDKHCSFLPKILANLFAKLRGHNRPGGPYAHLPLRVSMNYLRFAISISMMNGSV